MPRDGSGVYAQPYPSVVSGTTIESAKYNGNVTDVAQDLNLPRPIVAGGTGANNARDAMTSLQGDVAYQVVTNYDAYAFVSGSFYSAAGATSAPTANAFAGHCYSSDPAVVPPAVPASNNLFIEARDQITGKLYIRAKTAGVWAAWTAGIAADIDAAYVNVTGDTMTGPLTVNATIASAQTTTTGAYYFGNGVKYLGYDGTNFNLVGGILIVNSQVMSAQSSITGTYHFGNAGTKYLNYDGTNFNLVGGGFVVNGTVAATSDLYVHSSASNGAIFFGNLGGKYLQYDGTNFNLVGGTNFTVSRTLILSGGLPSYLMFDATGTKYLQYDGTNFNLTGGNALSLGATAIYAGDTYASRSASTGVLFLGTDQAGYLFRNAPTTAQLQGLTLQTNGYVGKQGLSGGFSTVTNNFFYTAGVMQMWADVTNMGNVAISSDYRIKKDVLDLPSMWDAVKGLRPIKYTQAQFSPPSHVEYVAQQALLAKKDAEENPEAKPREVSTAPLFPADDIERWGFIAHELQATLTPSAATGVKDSPNEVQSPQWTTVVAALTKALQEAMARIEALEAR